MKIHPAAEIFPEMSAKAFAELKADIQANGQQEAILLYDNEILDGRHRYRACTELGIEPEFAEAIIDRLGDPVSYVISKNLHRRHLSESQRAIIAGKAAQLRVGRPSTEETPQIWGIKSVQQAADAVNVGRGTVESAKKVLAKGDESVINAVSQGDLPVSVAEQLVKVEPDKKKQAEAIKKGKEEVKKVVKAKQDEKRQAESAPTERDVAQRERESLLAVWKQIDNRLNALRGIWLTLSIEERNLVAAWCEE